jgi:hypothetical protein
MSGFLLLMQTLQEATSLLRTAQLPCRRSRVTLQRPLRPCSFLPAWSYNTWHGVKQRYKRLQMLGLAENVSIHLCLSLACSSDMPCPSTSTRRESVFGYDCNLAPAEYYGDEGCALTKTIMQKSRILASFILGTME